MKRLSVFSIKAFIGPFLVTFAISMFILIMQFFWKYIDDLMGKGIETIYIFELLFYISLSLIPMALPLAMLLSSIMTMGNLAENNELTALKASGLSLYRILRPLSGMVIIIAICTFLFANFVIPLADAKWRSLIYDFQNTKIASIITPGVYTKELGEYAIKVQSKNEDGSFNNIIIHDKTNPQELKTVRAKKAELFKTENNRHIFFNLTDGFIIEELSITAPVFGQGGVRIDTQKESRETRRTTFEQATYKIELGGFSVNKGDATNFEDSYAMLTVFEINSAIDSVAKKGTELKMAFAENTISTIDYFQSKNYQKMLDTIPTSTSPSDQIAYVTQSLKLDSLSTWEQNQVYTNQINKVQTRIQQITTQIDYFNSVNKNNNKYLVEFHRKFALTYAIIVLFFVGAPLGAIIRKGGFGAPVVIAALLFMIYFVLNTVGENLVYAEVLGAFVGMWFPSLILTPIAIILMYAAANDSPIFSAETYTSFFNRMKRKQK